MNRLNKLGHTEPYQPLREDRWELFALNLSEGKSIPQSYIDAGYSRNKSTAKVCGARLLAKPIVKARVAYLENNCHLSREELLARWCENSHSPSAKRSMSMNLLWSGNSSPVSFRMYRPEPRERTMATSPLMSMLTCSYLSVTRVTLSRNS